MNHTAADYRNFLRNVAQVVNVMSEASHDDADGRHAWVRRIAHQNETLILAHSPYAMQAAIDYREHTERDPNMIRLPHNQLLGHIATNALWSEALDIMDEINSASAAA